MSNHAQTAQTSAFHSATIGPARSITARRPPNRVFLVSDGVYISIIGSIPQFGRRVSRAAAASIRVPKAQCSRAGGPKEGILLIAISIYVVNLRWDLPTSCWDGILGVHMHRIYLLMA